MKRGSILDFPLKHQEWVGAQKLNNSTELSAQLHYLLNRATMITHIPFALGFVFATVSVFVK